MKPLTDWPLSQRRRVRGVLTDIDDTLTTGGALTPAVLAALSRCREAGLMLVAVTGRPTYWAQPLLRLCGFDAVIAENGASAFWLDEHDRQQCWWYAEASVRLAQRQALEAFAQQLSARFPQVVLADDAPQRIGDLAFDIGENRPRLTAVEVEEIVAFIRSHGLFALASSIHVHASLVELSKQRTSTRILQDVFGIDDASARETFVFVGDSGNDASMFAHYPQAIGVANVVSFIHQLPKRPAYVTSAARGAGFVEVINTILEARET